MAKIKQPAVSSTDKERQQLESSYVADGVKTDISTLETVGNFL